MAINIDSIVKEKRLLAYLLDSAITLFVGFALILINDIVSVIGVATSLLTVEYAVLSNQIIFRLLLLGLCFFRDAITGRSYGKKILGIKIVTTDGNKPTRLQLIKKNLFSFLWFFEGFVLLARGKTIGETISKTKTVLAES